MNGTNEMEALKNLSYEIWWLIALLNSRKILSFGMIELNYCM